MEEERHQFDERNTMLSGEKSAVKDQLSFLDGEVGHFCQQVEWLEVEKCNLEERIKQQGGELEAEVLKRKALVEDMASVL